MEDFQPSDDNLKLVALIDGETYRLLLTDKGQELFAALKANVEAAKQKSEEPKPLCE